VATAILPLTLLLTPTIAAPNFSLRVEANLTPSTILPSVVDVSLLGSSGETAKIATAASQGHPSGPEGGIQLMLKLHGELHALGLWQ